jgi:hypothetical protein
VKNQLQKRCSFTNATCTATPRVLNAIAADGTVPFLARAAPVGLCNFNAVNPKLESAWFQPLSLSSEKLVSNVAFHKCDSWRYAPLNSAGEPAVALLMTTALCVTASMIGSLDMAGLGLYELNAFDVNSFKSACLVSTLGT